MGARHLELADQHEKKALELAPYLDRNSVTRAAAHFAIAEALRQRARYAK